MKSKLTWISILLVLLFLGVQYWVTLQGHIQLPSAEWSRATELSDVKSNYSVIESVKEENGYTVTLKDLKKQDIFSCGEDLIYCSFERTITDGSTYNFTYNDVQNSYYIKDGQLIWSSNGQEKVVAEATDFTLDDEKIAYWDDDFQVVVLNRVDLSEEHNFEMEKSVKFGKFVDNHLFIITEDPISRVFTAYLATEEPEQLFSFKVKSSENLQSIKLFADGEKYGILLDIEVLAGGGRSKTIYYSAFELKGQQLELAKVNFKEKESNNRIEDIRHPYILESAAGNRIAFSGAGYDASGEYATKIFVGDFTPETIEAVPVTKKEEPSSRPHLLDEENVLFFALDGKDKALAYSSSEPDKVWASSQIGEGDFKAAFIKLLTILMNGMVLLLVSFLWFLPALALTYGMQYAFRRMNRPLSEQSLSYFHAAFLFTTQVAVFTKIYHFEGFVSRIPFIQEGWQLLLLLAICIVVSILPILLVRKKVTEDNFNSTIMYITFLNLVLLLIIIGPYFI